MHVYKLIMHDCVYDCVCTTFQKKQLFIDLSEFSEMIQGALMNHLNTLNVSSKAGIAKIEEQVK